MEIDVLNFEETPDGGAVITVELDNEFVQVILREWLTETIKKAVHEIKDNGIPELPKKEGLASKSNKKKKKGTRKSSPVLGKTDPDGYKEWDPKIDPDWSGEYLKEPFTE